MDREEDLASLDFAALGPDQPLWVDVSLLDPTSDNLPPEIGTCAEPLDNSDRSRS